MAELIYIAMFIWAILLAFAFASKVPAVYLLSGLYSIAIGVLIISGYIVAEPDLAWIAGITLLGVGIMLIAMSWSLGAGE